MELTYDNGGTSTISLDEEACTASLDGAGVSSLDELVGQPWSIVLPALEQQHPPKGEAVMLDLVIRNGLIVDGSGLARPPRRRRRSRTARSSPSAAAPATRTRCSTPPAASSPPGSSTRTPTTTPSCASTRTRSRRSSTAITTVVPGNCSLSLAPLRAEQRDAFSRMFRLIEEMPEAAFDAGVDWRWGEGFGGWLDALAENIALNVAPLVGHSVLRMYVMGPEAQERAATADEIAAMADLLRACLDAGAVGLSTSFVDIDETYRPVPSRWAAPAELDALSAVLGERDAVLQIVHEFYDTELTIARVEQLAELSLRHGITTTLSPLFHSDANNHGVEPDHGRRRRRHEPAAPRCGRRCRPARSTSASRSTSAA